MYVDKPLSGIKAVQTLSRLNRAHPQKHDVFVLDFMNDADTIQAAFADYYRTTILSEETDPNKLHDLKADLDGYQVYAATQVDELVELYLGGADRDQLDPILDACVADLHRATSTRTARSTSRARPRRSRGPTASSRRSCPYTNAEWEKLSIFLNFLIPKLPAPKEEDLVEGHPRSDRHGQLPRREAGGDEDPAARRRTPRSSPVPTSGGGAQAGAGAGPALEHPQDLQRPVRQHRVDRRRPGRQADHRGDPEQGRRRHGLPERQAELRQAERPHRARQGARRAS